MLICLLCASTCRFCDETIFLDSLEFWHKESNFQPRTTLFILVIPYVSLSHTSLATPGSVASLQNGPVISLTFCCLNVHTTEIKYHRTFELKIF